MENNWTILKDKKIVLSGATGFIGSHLTRRLISEWADVYVISRENSNTWRIKDCLSQENILYCAIINKELLNRIIGEIKPDIVFHLAAYGVNPEKRDYLEAINTNIIGTANMVSVAIEAEVKLFINTGTCFEYGQKSDKIVEREYLEPTNIYGSTKAASVLLAHQMAREGGLKIITLRPFGIYGEGESRNKFFPYVILSLLNNESVELTKCEQKRDYIYIQDLIDAYILAAQSEHLTDEIINIGSGVAKSLRYFVETIKTKINSNLNINYGDRPYRDGEMWYLCTDIEKARNILGWKPKTSFEEGISKTIKWFKENNNY